MSEYFLPLNQIPLRDHSTIPTGLVDLDRLLDGGIPRPALTIISGYPGIGKTDLALQIARNAALTSEARVGIISLDMPVFSTARRLRSCPHAGLPTLPPNSNLISLWFVSGIEFQDLYQQVKIHQQQSGLDLLIVDRVEMIGQKTSLQTYAKRLKELAIEANIAAIGVTSTISEKTYLSKNPLFATADIVLCLDREDLRYSESEWERRFSYQPYPRGIVDIRVSKNRYGTTGSLTVLYFEPCGAYLNLVIRPVEPT